MILFLLKMLLFIFLGIIVLLSIALVTILVAPITYDIFVSSYEHMVYEINIKYLKGIKIRLDSSENSGKSVIHIFGFDINRYLDKKQEKEKVKHNKEIQKKPSSPLNNEYQKTSTQKQMGKVKEEENKKKNKTKNSSISIKTKKKTGISNKMDYQTVKALLRIGLKVIKIIAPRSWSFEVVIGMDNPADTGELIAKMTLLYPIYYKHGIIRGDYEKKCIMGGCLLEGKIRLYRFIPIVISIYRDKHLGKWIKNIKK